MRCGGCVSGVVEHLLRVYVHCLECMCTARPLPATPGHLYFQGFRLLFHESCYFKAKYNISRWKYAVFRFSVKVIWLQDYTMLVISTFRCSWDGSGTTSLHLFLVCISELAPRGGIFTKNSDFTKLQRHLEKLLGKIWTCDQLLECSFRCSLYTRKKIMVIEEKTNFLECGSGGAWKCQIIPRLHHISNKKPYIAD